MGHGQGRRGRGRLAKRRRRLAALQHRPPARAIGGELRPPRVVEVEDVHRLSHAAAVGQPRRAPRPRARHPRGQHAPRQALPAHAAHVSQPAQLPARDIARILDHCADVNGAPFVRTPPRQSWGRGPSPQGWRRIQARRYRRVFYCELCSVDGPSPWSWGRFIIASTEYTGVLLCWYWGPT